MGNPWVGFFHIASVTYDTAPIAVTGTLAFVRAMHVRSMKNPNISRMIPVLSVCIQVKNGPGWQAS